MPYNVNEELNNIKYKFQNDLVLKSKHVNPNNKIIL